MLLEGGGCTLALCFCVKIAVMLWFSGEVRDVFYGEFQDSS